MFWKKKRGDGMQTLQLTSAVMTQVYQSQRETMNPTYFADNIVRQALLIIFDNQREGRQRANDYWFDHMQYEVAQIAVDAANSDATRDEFLVLIDHLAAGDLVLTTFPYEDDMPEYAIVDASGYTLVEDWFSVQRRKAQAS